MKVYVLVLNLDIQNTPCGFESIIDISANREKLDEICIERNGLIDKDWDEDEMEFDGALMSSKPYYSVLEKEV